MNGYKWNKVAKKAARSGEKRKRVAKTLVPARKEYVFIPKPKRPGRFADEDLQFNDPLAIDTFGGAVRVDPDAENPFKMRKPKAS